VKKTIRATNTTKARDKKAAASTSKTKHASATPLFAAASASHKKSATGFGGEGLKKILSDSSSKTQQAQEQIVKISREGAEKISKATDAATRGINEAVQGSYNIVEAAIESSSVVADSVQAFASEVLRFANESFSDNMDITKEIFNCKTVNDVLDMQDKLMNNNIDSFFNESNRMHDMLFRFVADVSEPFNQQLIAASQKLAKVSASR
jgi:hypothetical protein